MAFAEVGMIKSIDIDRELKKQDKLIQQLHRPEISNVPHTINYNGHKYVLKPWSGPLAHSTTATP